jgi:formylglycine-generating enzyme required for sulfatase activity
VGCATWFVAYAFCIWDGGRLPTEAEWNHAAAGGSEQRQYPWSSPPSSTTINETYASYSCSGDGIASCAVTDFNPVGMKPNGNARWGHADMAGNAYEWVQDYFNAAYRNPCSNCARLDSAFSSGRAQRGGGSILSGTAPLLTSYRYNTDPTYLHPSFGMRCARSP